MSSIQPAQPSKLPWAAFARGVRDNLIAEVGSQGVRVVGIVILARMLRPDDFGVFRILTIVALFFMVFSESGIPDALIQRKDLQSSHEATGWWLMIGLTGICVAGLYILAPFFERVMEMPGLGFGLRLICVPSMLEGASIIANVRLRRQMRFGPIALSDVVGEIAFAVVAILLVWFGYPRWSLAGGLATRLSAHAIFILAAEPYAPRELPRAAAARDLGQFAATVLSGRMIALAAGNIDYLLVGRLLGSGALGFYSIAWDLLRFVPARLYRIAGRVALPAFARIQDDNKELARAYRNFVGYSARFVLPVAGCVAIAAPELVSSVYGVKWLPAATQTRILVVGLTMLGLRFGIGILFYAKKYPSFDLYLMGGRLALLTAIILLTARHGLSVVSVGVSAVEAMIGIAGQYLACSLTGLRFRDLLSAIVPGSRLALACMLATAVGKVVGMYFAVKAPFVLALVALPPAAIFFWLQAGDAAQMISTVFNPTPGKVVEAS